MKTETLGTPPAKRGRKIAKLAHEGAECVAMLACGVRGFFRDKHRTKVREKVAADYGVSDRQAGDWLRNGPPKTTLAMMIAREGMAFVNKVIHPIASREADAQHITVKEVIARRRAQREEARILARQSSSLAGAPGSRSDRAIRAAGAAIRLIAKLACRRKAVAP